MEIYLLWTGLFLMGALAGASAAVLVLRPRWTEARREGAELRARLDELQHEYGECCRALQRVEAESEARRDSLQAAFDARVAEVMALREEAAGLRARMEASLESHKQLREARQEQESALRTAFESIASRLFEEKSDKFTRLNEEKLRQVLDPLGKDIEHFRKQVEDHYVNQTRERASLGSELKQLMELNRRLGDEANALTRALKGEHNPKIQGDWGEMILDSILSNSGLVKGEHYFLQESMRDAEGNLLRPDVIVRYPDGREIIIDSKVSLTAYSRYAGASDEEGQQAAVKEHLASVRRHIDELSDKRYHSRDASLDFVMMFMPVEPAYVLALGADGGLWEYAYKKKVLLVSPTHLITALKLVYDLWKRDAQNRNALRIAERGAALYDKFVGFVADMALIEKNLDSTRRAYDTAMGKLSQGKGNLVRQAEMLKELGVKTEKELGKTVSRPSGPEPEETSELPAEA